MTKYQRSIYKIAIQTEWMSENAFTMAWNDFACLPKNTKFTDVSSFINWLFE